MLACARIGATHTVVFGGFSAEALRDRINDCGAVVCITADGGWRRGKNIALKANVDEALAQTPTVKSCLVVRRTGEAIDMQAGPRRLVARRRPEGVGRLRAGQPAGRAPAVHPLHVGHDGQAEGHRAHHGRLPAGRAPHDQVRVRPARRRRLLVHRRRRLGHRAQLRRLRPALERGDDAHLRRRARSQGQGSLLGHHRAPQGHDLLHGAHGDPRVHALGRSRAEEARPLVAAAAGQRRRADQPRGVDVVPQRHRRRALPDRRHLVADRDGRAS